MTKLIVVAGLLGIALLLAFLGILIAWVKALPLIVIILAVIAMMLWDFISHVRESRTNDADRV